MTDEKPLPKQVIVMRTDLKMRRGKQIAQGAHASMKVLLDRMTTPREIAAELWRNTRASPESSLELKLVLDHPMADWVLGIFTKVCCRVESEEELDAIYEKAKEAGLPCALIIDVGKTEFNGVPTKTCCAIGPALPEDIDPITGHLKLL